MISPFMLLLSLHEKVAFLESLWCAENHALCFSYFMPFNSDNYLEISIITMILLNEGAHLIKHSFKKEQSQSPLCPTAQTCPSPQDVPSLPVNVCASTSTLLFFLLTLTFHP